MAGSRTHSTRPVSVRSAGVLLAATLLTGGAVALVLLRHRVLGGVLAVAGGALILVGWFAAEREATARSRFVAMLVDPLYDAALLASIAWVARVHEPRVSELALIALGLCYLAAYERARADALGFRTFESIGYRAARSALIALGLLSGWYAAALSVLIAAAAGAVAVRALNVAIQHRRSGRVERAPSAGVSVTGGGNGRDGRP